MNLGAYADSIRRYLRGETSFPSEMVLSLSVLPTAAAVVYFHLPFETQAAEGYTTFHFYIPGLNYTLWVGSEIPTEVSQMCLSTIPNVVLVFDCSKEIIRRFKEAYESASKKRSKT
jgi:hypothetical protein